MKKFEIMFEEEKVEGANEKMENFEIINEEEKGENKMEKFEIMFDEEVVETGIVVKGKREKISRKNKKAKEDKKTNEKMAGLKANPNDECYTSTRDIYSELWHWGEMGKFRGKNIICPCDWDITDSEQNVYSITITYRDDITTLCTNNVNHCAYKDVKELKYDLFAYMEDQKQHRETKVMDKNDIEDFLREKITCGFISILTSNAAEWGIKSITASGYNPELDLGVKFQDVDYSQYDVCITNPPFSLYKEFMKCVVDKIDFVLLAPRNNRITPNIGLPLLLKKAYLGYNVEKEYNFTNPTKENNFHSKTVCCDWIASYPEAQQERNAKHYCPSVKYEYYKDEYATLDNITMKDGTHPIIVPSRDFPGDYNGWMFAPGAGSILTKLDQSKYEWYGTNFKGYLNANPSISPFAHKATNEMLYCTELNKKVFHGIVFRKKPNQD